MRTHSIYAGEAPVSHARVPHARHRYLEVPGKMDLVREVAHEDIARRAYEIFLARGARDGDALGDWLAAERELKGGVAVFPPLTKRSDSDVAH